MSEQQPHQEEQSARHADETSVDQLVGMSEAEFQAAAKKAEAGITDKEAELIGNLPMEATFAARAALEESRDTLHQQAATRAAAAAKRGGWSQETATALTADFEKQERQAQVRNIAHTLYPRPSKGNADPHKEDRIHLTHLLSMDLPRFQELAQKWEGVENVIKAEEVRRQNDKAREQEETPEFAALRAQFPSLSAEFNPTVMRQKEEASQATFRQVAHAMRLNIQDPIIRNNVVRVNGGAPTEGTPAATSGNRNWDAPVSRPARVAGAPDNGGKEPAQPADTLGDDEWDAPVRRSVRSTTPAAAPVSPAPAPVVPNPYASLATPHPPRASQPPTAAAQAAAIVGRASVPSSAHAVPTPNAPTHHSQSPNHLAGRASVPEHLRADLEIISFKNQDGSTTSYEIVGRTNGGYKAVLIQRDAQGREVKGHPFDVYGEDKVVFDYYLRERARAHTKGDVYKGTTDKEFMQRWGSSKLHAGDRVDVRKPDGSGFIVYVDPLVDGDERRTVSYAYYDHTGGFVNVTRKQPMQDSERLIADINEYRHLRGPISFKSWEAYGKQLNVERATRKAEQDKDKSYDEKLQDRQQNINSTDPDVKFAAVDVGDVTQGESIQVYDPSNGHYLTLRFNGKTGKGGMKVNIRDNNNRKDFAGDDSHEIPPEKWPFIAAQLESFRKDRVPLVFQKWW